MSIQLSVTLIAIAFACLAFYGIMALRKTMGSLDETNKTLAEVRSAVHNLSYEATGLVHSATQITADVKGKMKAVNPIIESAHDVGEALHSVANTVKQAAAQLGPGSTPASEPIKHKVNIKVK